MLARRALPASRVAQRTAACRLPAPLALPVRNMSGSRQQVISTPDAPAAIVCEPTTRIFSELRLSPYDAQGPYCSSAAHPLAT